jgi:hypothetical protein
MSIYKNRHAGCRRGRGCDQTLTACYQDGEFKFPDALARDILAAHDKCNDARVMHAAVGLGSQGGVECAATCESARGQPSLHSIIRWSSSSSRALS